MNYGQDGYSGDKTKLRRRVTISISHETHTKLSQLRQNGESIDDAILRVLNEAVKRPDISAWWIISCSDFIRNSRCKPIRKDGFSCYPLLRERSIIIDMSVLSDPINGRWKNTCYISSCGIVFFLTPKRCKNFRLRLLVQLVAKNFLLSLKQISDSSS